MPPGYAVGGGFLGFVRHLPAEASLFSPVLSLQFALLERFFFTAGHLINVRVSAARLELGLRLSLRAAKALAQGGDDQVSDALISSGLVLRATLEKTLLGINFTSAAVKLVSEQFLFRPDETQASSWWQWKHRCDWLARRSSLDISSKLGAQLVFEEPSMLDQPNVGARFDALDARLDVMDVNLGHRFDQVNSLLEQLVASSSPSSAPRPTDWERKQFTADV